MRITTFLYFLSLATAIFLVLVAIVMLLDGCSPGGPLAPPSPGAKAEVTSITGPQKVLIILTTVDNSVYIPTLAANRYLDTIQFACDLPQTPYPHSLSSITPYIDQAHAETWWLLNSFGTASLSLTIVGPYPAPANVTTTQMIALADPDVDFNEGYYGIMFARPGASGGSSGGPGDYGINTDEGFILISGLATLNGSHTVNQSVWLHEMMHMFGPSDSYRYDSPTVGPGFPYSGSGSTYTDCHTVMGGPHTCNPDPLGDLVAYDKHTLGWITPRIATLTEYTLTDYETTGDALLIPKNATRSYYLELRDGKLQLRLRHALLTDDLSTFTDTYGPTLVATGPTVTLTYNVIDLTLPASNFIMPNPLVGDVTFNMAPYDSSGIYQVEFRNGHNTWRITDLTPPFTQVFPSEAFEDGPVTFYITLVDNAGNDRRYTYNTTINNTNPPIVGIP